mmetsp:Transcript_10594/g.21628  ORF Transcript_10594/g.21628 Transcript_10594/m.21628 type:complete len:225 (+) Transcript_10594:783-1457(+)
MSINDYYDSNNNKTKSKDQLRIHIPKEKTMNHHHHLLQDDLINDHHAADELASLYDETLLQQHYLDVGTDSQWNEAVQQQQQQQQQQQERHPCTNQWETRLGLWRQCPLATMMFHTLTTNEVCGTTIDTTTRLYLRELVTTMPMRMIYIHGIVSIGNPFHKPRDVSWRIPTTMPRRLLLLLPCLWTGTLRHRPCIQQRLLWTMITIIALPTTVSVSESDVWTPS